MGSAGALALVALALVACDDDDGVSSNTAELSLLLTDAPGNVEEAWVEISEITMQGEGGAVVLLDEPTGLVNLIELQDETLELVEDLVVPAGTYTQLRLRVSGGVVVSEEGGVFTFGGAEHPGGLQSTGTLNCPSCQTPAGLRIKLPDGSTEIEGDANILVLDFDVSQSFGDERGASNMWVMHPVIHATDFGVSGGISGTVALDDGVTIPECPAEETRGLDDFVVTATAETLTDDDGNLVERRTSPNTDGDFSIGFVHPDDYDMGFVADIEFETDALVFEATVDPGQVTVGSGDQVSGVSYTITSASCEAVEE